MDCLVVDVDIGTRGQAAKVRQQQVMETPNT